MGQTVNPNIFRLGKTKNWASKYFAKKTSETSVYAFKDLEIRKFIEKFFKDNGLTISNCKINYSDDGSLHIFVSYYLTIKSLTLAENESTNNSKLNLSRFRNKNSRKRKKTKKQLELEKKIKNFIKFRRKTHFRLIKNFVREKNFRTRLLNHYKAFLTANRNFKTFDSIKPNSFTTKLFNSLHFFLKKNIKIFLTLQQLNKNTQQSANKDKAKFLKKSLIKLRRYRQNEFFKEGVSILFMSTTENQMADLLSQFISTHLSKSKKKHNFFLKFLKTTLTLFENNPFSNVKGIKIRINGRLNGRPRAKHKIINIGNGVPAISLKSNINYAESTAFTANGTLGVKVWICNTI
jgi:hypothetical protein